MWAWRVELRNFTANGDYLSSTKNFLHAKNVNGLTLEGVFVQSFNLGIALDSSYAVALRGVTFRYIRQHVIWASTASMQLKLIDVRSYRTNDGAATPPNAAIILSASNANISMIGCDFEGGKSSFAL